MNKLFVPYHLAVLAKEKGFDEPCLSYYWELELHDWWKNPCYTTNSVQGKDEDCVAAPLYQQLVDFLREKYNISIELHWQQGTEGWYFCYGYNAGKWYFPKGTFKYYEALNKALEEAFKLI